MKAPRYILKKAHIEDWQHEEYRNHMKRLTHIHKQTSQLRYDIAESNKINDQRRRYYQIDQEHRESEYAREQHRINQSLVSRLIQINNRDLPFERIKRRKAHSQHQRSETDTSINGKSMVARSISAAKSNASNASLTSQPVGRYNEEKIYYQDQHENLMIVERLTELPPVVPTKKKHDQEYKEQRQLVKRIQRFHIFKERKPLELKQFTINTQIAQEELPLFDESNLDLTTAKVLIFITVKNIEIFNFLPVIQEKERYFSEIKISSRNPRRSLPETYDNFSKQVINESFNYQEILTCRTMYDIPIQARSVGLFQLKDGNERFLGDFELDITPYFLKNGKYLITFDIRNLREQLSRPHYMQKDLRRRGTITLTAKFSSRLWQYILPAEQQTNPKFTDPAFLQQFEQAPSF